MRFVRQQTYIVVGAFLTPGVRGLKILIMTFVTSSILRDSCSIMVDSPLANVHLEKYFLKRFPPRETVYNDLNDESKKSAPLIREAIKYIYL